MAEVSSRPNGPQPGTLQRVLLVDDNDSYAEVLAEDLKKLGVEDLVRAYNAREAVDLLAREGDTIDGVVTDISMESQISGLKVLRAARRHGSRRLVAVASTGLDTFLGFWFNYVALGLLYRSDYLIPKRPIKREKKVIWIPVKGRNK